MKDLVLLVADKNAQFALKGELGRPKAFGIRAIDFDIQVHPGRDGGARKGGSDLLALLRRRYGHALLVLDFEGCGTELPDAIALENELDCKLAEHWGNRAKAIVIEPELDVWVWGTDNAVETAIGWPSGKGIREWLCQNGFDLKQNSKPVRPKEALEAALLEINLPRSSALYGRIAERLSLRRCSDESFIRLREKLSQWFSE